MKTINIKGKEYTPVNERVLEALKTEKKLSITTEIIQHTPNVVIRATITTERGTFTGTSWANPTKAIEKASPYEVAETSAVGRALGFAGYGIISSIASSDEIIKAKDYSDEPF